MAVDGVAPFQRGDEVSAHVLRGQQMQQHRRGGVVGFNHLLRPTEASVEQRDSSWDGILRPFQRRDQRSDGFWRVFATHGGDIERSPRPTARVARLSRLPGG
jgi:hypothetical protein